MSEENFFESEWFVGDSLRQLKEATKEPRVPLIEGFVYEKSATMFFADDGVGKSILIFQAVCQASQGVPVFGYLACPKPLKTIWIQAERHPIEIGERLEKFSSMFEPDYNNIIVTSKLQGINLEDDKHKVATFEHLDKIVKVHGEPDLIVIDPIYALTKGDISKSDAANCITRFSTRLQTKYSCSTIFIHHTNRGSRNEQGERTGEDFYGSRFLSAHFSGMFHIKRRAKGHIGAEFTQKKDSFSVLMRGFRLDYDTESGLSTIDDQSFNRKDKIAHVLRCYKTTNKLFTINELIEDSQVSPNIVYSMKKGELRSGFVDTGKTNGKAKLYESHLE